MDISFHAKSIALNLEMAVANRYERKYHSDRSRNKDIVADFKEIVRHEIDQCDTKEEEAIVYGLGYLLNNKYLDDRTATEFTALISEVVKFLKSITERGETKTIYNAEDFNNEPTGTDSLTRATTTKTYTGEEFFGGK